MVNIENDTEDNIPDENLKIIDKKKFLLFLLPILIVIGLIVSFYSISGKKINSEEELPYTVVDKSAAEDGSKKNLLIFYDLPEINVQIKNADGKRELAKIRLSIEIPTVDDIKIIEGLMPQIADAIIAHTLELTEDELQGSDSLYYLKEELQYRINLITDPIKVTNLNIKNFEILKK